MGRGKQPIELIGDEKARCKTYDTRKTGLKKKLHEFTTLCGVDACMVIYGPYQDDHHLMEVDTWPPNSDKLIRVISKFKSKENDGKAKTSSNIVKYFENLKQKIEDDVVKTRRANIKAKFSTWDDRMNHVPLCELVKIDASIDNKYEYATSFMKNMKENTRLIKGGGGGERGGAVNTIGGSIAQFGQNYHHPNSYMHDGMLSRNMQQLDANNFLPIPKPLMKEGGGGGTPKTIDGSTVQLGQNHHHNQPPSNNYMYDMLSRNMQQFDANRFLANPDKPLDACFSANHMHDQGLQTRYLDVNTMPSNTSMMKMEKHDYSMLGGFPVGIHMNQYPTMNAFMNFDQASAMQYRSPMIQQLPLQQAVKNEVVQNDSEIMMPSSCTSTSRVHTPQVFGYYDLNNFQFTNKRARF